MWAMPPKIIERTAGTRALTLYYTLYQIAGARRASVGSVGYGEATQTNSEWAHG
jgi:hypothetical protein